jgi:uncharacterized membrane protein
MNIMNAYIGTVNIINKNKESTMGRIISTLIICYVAVTYYPADKIIPPTPCHAPISITIRTETSGTDGEAESGAVPIDTGDRTAPGNEESES